MYYVLHSNTYVIRSETYYYYTASWLKR